MNNRMAATLLALILAGSTGAWGQTVEMVDPDSHSIDNTAAAICVTAEDIAVEASQCPVIKWDGWTFWFFSVEEDTEFSVLATDGNPDSHNRETTIHNNSRLVYIDIDPTGSYAVIGGQADDDAIVWFGSQAPEISIIAGQLALFLSTGECLDCDLKGADLAGLDLSNARLSGTNLTGAKLEHTSLADADLTDTDLTNVDLRGVDLGGANLTGATFQGVRFYFYGPDKTDFTGADLTNANLSGFDDSHSLESINSGTKSENALSISAEETGNTDARATLDQFKATLMPGVTFCNTTMPDLSLDNSGC